jgi:response regulator NasT
LASAETAMMNFERMLQLEKEVNRLKDTIETRKIVEKAKGLLMEKLGMSEAEAFHKMQHQSMDKCIPMKQVADAIILTYDIDGKKK